MKMADKHIVAIDLGTSKIALTVARINGRDVQIVYYKETPSEGIRYSSVYNQKQVTEPLVKAVRDAEECLGIKIMQAVVGMSRFPIRQEANTALFPDRGYDTDITSEDIAELKRFAQDSYPLSDSAQEAIYGAVAQSFSDGENFQIIENDIIGMSSDVLEGTFKIFIGKKSDLTKIDLAMNKADLTAARKYFTADSTAKAVLEDSEMENGVALIDFGGGCTSVSIYHGNIMRHYASIPFGGKNITSDIKSECEISEKLAENIKKAFGACMPDKLQNLSEKVIHIKSSSTEPNKQLPVKYLSEIITARVEEIMMAMIYEIQESGFADMIRSGIVVTGGSALLPNLGAFINDLSGFKVRTGFPKKLFSCQGCEAILEPSASASMGLILAAYENNDDNCAHDNGAVQQSEEPAGDGNLFPADSIETVDNTPKPAPAPVKPKTPGKPQKKGVWKDKIGSFVGNIFESVMNEVESER
ncbi:MAG: cell division protein FtsA [Bacteroidales bacterium]|nr:cell division protein FtsA [Bacteroidales bacterium]